MMIMKPIVRRLTVLCTDATSQDVVIDAWPAEVKVRWQRITARDLGNVCTRIEILFKRGSRDYMLQSTVAAVVHTAVSVDGPIFVPGDFRVCARFVGATLANTLELYAFGDVIDDAA